MQQKEKDMRPGGREDWFIKIIETAGNTLENVLVRADPFNGNKCLDSKCIPNNNVKNTIGCRRNNVGYELRCKLCHWDGSSDHQQDPATYFGETGENMHTRMKSHESKFRSKQLHIRKGSAFYIHMVNEHPEQTLENKPIDDFFEVNILKAYQKVLTRLVDEGTNLNSHNGPILNSKTEWHQPKLIRTTILQGGAEMAGGMMVGCQEAGRQGQDNQVTVAGNVDVPANPPAHVEAKSRTTGAMARAAGGL